MTPDSHLTPTAALTVSPTPSPSDAAGALATGPQWGGLALLALTVVAWVVTRRRGRTARRLELLESMNLGPRRSLGLVRVDARLLVVGVSEAGVQLLTTLDAPAAPADTEPSDVPVAAEALAFERLLEESTTEQELRARLAAARRSEVLP